MNCQILLYKYIATGGVAGGSGQHAHNTTGVTVHRQSLLGDEAVVFSHTTLCMMSVCMCVVFPHSTFSPV